LTLFSSLSYTRGMKPFSFVLLASLLTACGSQSTEPTASSTSSLDKCKDKDKSKPKPYDCPEPPPPPACTTHEQGGPTSTSCKSAETWKLYASQDCTANGKTLTEYTLGTSCGEGVYTGVTYQCCPAEANPCPASPTDWAVGAPCTEPLVCDYPTACGYVDQWHCKYGTWQPNTITSCP
jgi:hypothetical protein